jgi:hypothetical protein
VLWRASEPQLEPGRGEMQASSIKLEELTLPSAPTEVEAARDESEGSTLEPEPELAPKPAPSGPRPRTGRRAAEGGPARSAEGTSIAGLVFVSLNQR